MGHTNMRKLREGPGPDNVYDVVNDKKRNKKGSKYKNSGTVNLRKSEVHLVPSFLDYIQGGTQVNFTLAVDFTASNGNPMDPNSLHYRGDPSRPNQYVTAIRSVGEIVQDYDSDSMFPALGFGARIPRTGPTQATTSSCSSSPTGSSPTLRRPKRASSAPQAFPCPSSSWGLVRRTSQRWTTSTATRNF